jgi:hypothetical protein
LSITTFNVRLSLTIFIAILAALSGDELKATIQSSPVTVAYDPPPALVLHEPVLVEFRIENNLKRFISTSDGTAHRRLSCQ